MAKINDLPLLSNPTEDMYCLVGKEDLQKVPWSAIMGQIGAPYIATTVAGMTDKTRVYVYQGSESGYTSGNWYYWNGSAWTSGGTYNSAAVDTDKTLTQSDKPADSAVVGKEIGLLKEDLDYKQNTELMPTQFETIVGYYKGTEFVEGQRAWGARIARVSVQSGEKYRYMYSTDLPTIVTFLNDEKNVISQITVARNTRGIIDVYIPDGVAYADFYSAFHSEKFECLKYSNSSKLESMIFSDDIESFKVISNRYFSPSQEELVVSNGQQLYSYTATESSIFRISFIQHQPFTAYVDDFCCVDSNDYVNGTEVYRENYIVYVPKGKTLRINSYISSNEEEKTKIEKYIEISEKYINEKIPEIEEVVDVV
jgi:hypothetical protein